MLVFEAGIELFIDGFNFIVDLNCSYVNIFSYPSIFDKNTQNW